MVFVLFPLRSPNALFHCFFASGVKHPHALNTITNSTNFATRRITFPSGTAARRITRKGDTSNEKFVRTVRHFSGTTGAMPGTGSGGATGMRPSGGPIGAVRPVSVRIGPARNRAPSPGSYPGGVWRHCNPLTDHW